MNSPTEREDQNAEERERRIVAYAIGDMAPHEAAAFEREMEADAALRREAEQWRAAFESGREWMTAEPPGVERIEALDARSLVRSARSARRPARVLTLRRVVWRVAAAAAIFGAGVWVGQLLQGGTAAPVPDGESEAPMSQQAKPRDTPPTERQGPDGRPSPRAVAERDRPATARDENGRLVIETTLKSSGARALWVVDGSFDLAQASVQP